MDKVNQVAISFSKELAPVHHICNSLLEKVLPARTDWATKPNDPMIDSSLSAALSHLVKAHDEHRADVKNNFEYTCVLGGLWSVYCATSALCGVPVDKDFIKKYAPALKDDDVFAYISLQSGQELVEKAKKDPKGFNLHMTALTNMMGMGGL
ncbi:hypothetical protein KEM56_002312 [Ascosphaera pollenicola]|nr:hypothetical protein KEM56_002312 [Ascosphaera pollenicola]